MATPTRFKTLQVGDKKNSATGASEAFGTAVVSQSALVTFADTTAKDLFVIPANSQIIDFYVDVLTVFNSSGTDLLDIGVSGTAQLFADDLVVSAAARLLGSSKATKLLNYDDIGASQITVQGLYKQSVADATTGNARITVVYCPGNNLE